MTESQAGKATGAAADPDGSVEEQATGTPEESAPADSAGGDRVVVRNKRKIDGGTGDKSGTTAPAEAAAEPQPKAAEEPAVSGDEVAAVAAPAEVPEAADTALVDSETELAPLGAELDAVRADLAELTKDLQRVSAEYANYRKRVERDRALVVEQATGVVLASLLPVLDDLDRAREHGDLVGPFASVAEQLVATLGKYGLTPFGEKGEAFDPTRHEAVAHQTSAEVTEPTCVEVMRRGYLLGDRLLRPALVAVADPE